MSKICNNCSNTVDDNVKFCPHCKSQSFRPKAEVAAAGDGGIVHKLFYWNYGGKYILAKSKLVSILVFILVLMMAIPSGIITDMIGIPLLFMVLVFLLGFGIHQLTGMPSKPKLDNNNYGFLTDLKNLLFYWQNSKGEYVLSKTKIISHIVFVICFFASVPIEPFSLETDIMVGIFFEIPVFAVGYLIHRFTNPDPQPKKIEAKSEPAKPVVTPEPVREIPAVKVVPEYEGYKNQLDELKTKFTQKDNSVRNLIEKRFEPPQLTYTRFISGVDKSKELFNKNYDAAMNMIRIADEYSPRIAGEVESKIDILKSINEKLDSLSNELVINEDLSSKEDVDNLIDEMDELINSVKDYE